ncbi:cytochrome P450 6a8-like [Drosophila tropicalis]|uniref:cytochrome P450 6a8-like n=1 Tax=Drosophila tropicalis TaxID=46794 RepID=UPI0035ABEE28
MAFCCLSFYLIGAIVALILLYLHRRYTYWTRRGVVQLEPKWIFGNMDKVGKTQSLRDPFREFYNTFRGKEKFGGFYVGTRQTAVLLDLDLIKHVMIKDFQNFANRGNYYNEKDDPLMAHLFNLDGQKWRNMRTKLTPTFTSLKMHHMYPIIVEIGDRFINLMNEEMLKARAVSNNGEAAVEVKDLLARFTTDVIGSCAFGLDCNSLKDPNAEFRAVSRRMLSKRRHGPIVMSLMNTYPNLARKLHMKFLPDYAAEFYLRVIKESIDHRDKNNIKRGDFLNLVMEMREAVDGMTFNQIAAQCFVFLLAGFETSSSTMGFALYELALNQDVQEKARQEVNQILGKHGELTYEAMKELKYLQQVLYETMRKWPILPILTRLTEKDYPVPGTNSQVFEAGTQLIIPADAIQHDPEIYPDPEKFDPERFSPEAVEQRHAMTWLPFGSGPRNCIGSRFGEMQSIVGLALLLKNFKFVPAKETPIPLQLDKKSFLLSSDSGIVLDVQSI